MSALLDPELWAALLTLTALEIVLGIDNIVFLTLMTGRLPAPQQPAARFWGLAGAMVTRILLLLSIAWMARLTQPLLAWQGLELSGRDLILLAGGAFLLGKSTLEIHGQIEGDAHGAAPAHAGRAAFWGVILQIMLLDIVFSLDSVITAVGMTPHVPVMVAAIVIAILVMMLFSGPVSRFVDAHPTIRVLALSFLLLIGMALIGEGLGFHIPKGYIYFAMAFSLGVELLNMRLRARRATPEQDRD
jgi:Membrane protein TerC, possibly involved in tellurium resistance